VLADLRYAVGSLRRRALGWKPYPDAVEPPCALCGSSLREIVGRRVAFQMRYPTVLCLDCGLVYLSPRPDEGSFRDFYERLYPLLYGKMAIDPGPSERGAAVVAFLDESLNLQAERGLLDIGCGGGGLLRAAAVRVVDGRPLLAGCDPGWLGHRDTLLEQDGVPIEILKRPVEELGGRLGEYSVFVLYDVLEHLLDPRVFLTTLHRLGPADACLFVSTSNLDDWRAIPPAGWESYYLRLAHTYTFTERTLEALLAGTGWALARRARAPKGDQWVLARRAAPRLEALAPIPGHADHVRSLIAAYRASTEG